MKSGENAWLKVDHNISAIRSNEGWTNEHLTRSVCKEEDEEMNKIGAKRFKISSPESLGASTVCGIKRIYVKYHNVYETNAMKVVRFDCIKNHAKKHDARNCNPSTLDELQWDLHHIVGVVGGLMDNFYSHLFNTKDPIAALYQMFQFKISVVLHFLTKWLQLQSIKSSRYVMLPLFTKCSY
ncbi:unnamed protein product [Lactuca saligna]|uniref:Uncharacterized protein n=1 Tax=Lactuca saligna TaxID=75948 RepID=A0AA36E952_LACSI|nr:unnamed protein product [Lactuca saligna]